MQANSEEERIPPFAQFPIVPKSCTCGRRLGMYQQTIEAAIKRYLDQGLELGESQRKAFDDLGLRKLCCRNSLIVPYIFINDEENNALIDLTLQGNDGISSANSRGEGRTVRTTYGWNPRTKDQYGGIPEFDEDQYVKQLADISRLPNLVYFSRLQVVRHEGYNP